MWVKVISDDWPLQDGPSLIILIIILSAKPQGSGAETKQAIASTSW